MKPHYQYLLYVIRHKWFVFLEACKLGIPILSLFHDWSKFRPSEWFPYVHRFFGSDRPQKRDKSGYYNPHESGDLAFQLGWFWHQKRNKHHWQYWTLPSNGGQRALPIPDKYLREMLADWRGASRAQAGKTGSVKNFYEINGKQMHLHDATRAWIEEQLGVTS